MKPLYFVMLWLIVLAGTGNAQALWSPLSLQKSAMPPCQALSYPSWLANETAMQSLIVIATALGLILSLWLLRKLSAQLGKYLKKRVLDWQRLRLNRVDLRPAVASLATTVTNLGAIFLGFYLAAIWAAVAFNQFPTTRQLGERFTKHLSGLAMDSLTTFIGAIPGLIVAIIIFTFAKWLTRVIKHVIGGLEKSSDPSALSNDTARATKRLAIAGTWIFATVLAYPYLPGSGSEAFKGLSVLLGLMVSLGSAGMINQIMSGFVLLYSNSVRTGEYIKIGDIEGKVTEIRLLAVKFITPQKEYLTIPNAVMISNPSTNFSRLATQSGVPIKVAMTIGYDAPWRLVHELMLSSARQLHGLMPTPEPYVRQRALLDHYVEYCLICYVTDPESRAAALSELNQHLQDAFNEAGIQIMSPHYRDDKPEPLVIPKERWFPKLG